MPARDAAPRDSLCSPRAMQPERKPHFSLVRSFVLADLFTIGNATCGTVSIFLCLSWLDARAPALLWTALALLPLALVLDVLDGAVARWRRRHSPLGADLDSLADVVSFGVAPATLAFTLGMRGGWDVVALVYFVVCGIARLARFNVTAAALADERTGKVKYFEGTPIPSSVLLVGVLAAAFGAGAVHDELWLGAHRLGPWILHPLVLLFVLNGTTMISATLRVPKP